MHVRAKHTHIELVINTSSVDGVLEQTENLLPRWRLSPAGIDEATEDLFSCLEITVGEFVVLDPTLRYELTSLLNEGMEPRKKEHQGQFGLILRLARSRNYLLEGSLQVVANTRRSLIGDFQTGLEQNGGELDMRLRSQPKSELLLRLEHLELLLEDREPRSDQVEVLEADPLSLNGSLLDGFNSSLVSTTTHSDFVESVSADSSFSELLKFCTRIRSRRDDKEDGVSASGLIGVQVLEGERSWLNVLVTKGFLDEEGHSGLKSVRSQHLNQQATLEGSKIVYDLAGEFLFRGLGLSEASPDVVVIKGKSRHDLAESVAVHAEHLNSIDRSPLGQLHSGIRAGTDASREELPLILLEHLRVDSLDEVHRVSQSISLE